MTNRTIWIAVFFVLLVGVVTRLLWLAVLLALIVGYYLLISKLKFLNRPTWGAKLSRSLLVFLLIFNVAISVRVFLFEVFAIPSSSMEDTLIPGDIIFCK